MAARRDERNVVLAQVGTPRASSAGDDAALLSARARVIRDEDARELAAHDAARAFLSMQASSASAERLFRDAGYQKGTRRQTNEPSRDGDAAYGAQLRHCASK